MTVAERVAGWFVAAPATGAPAAAATRRAEVAVIAAGAVAAGAAAVVAAGLAPPAPCAVVLCWRADPGRGPALPGHRAARRTRGLLDTEGVPARVRGRLVVGVLPPDEAEAEVTARRVGAVLPPGTPVVLALGGPRGPALESLLADLPDVRVATGADSPLGALACQGARAVAGGAVSADLLPGPVRRRAALAGLPVGGRGPAGTEAFA